MANYYSLDGLDYSFRAMWETETLKDTAIAVGVGAGALLLGGKAVNYLGTLTDPMIEDAPTREYVKSGMAVLVGFLGAAYLHQFNEPAAFALAGSLAGAGLAKMVRQVSGGMLDASYGLAEYDNSAYSHSGMGRASVELQRALANPAVYGRLPLSAAVVTPGTRENGLAGAAAGTRFQSWMQ